MQTKPTTLDASAPPEQSEAPSIGKPSTLGWTRLPNEPDFAYQEFLVYIKNSCAIAGKIVEVRMPLNHEILQHTYDPDMLKEAFHWHERLPSFFGYVAQNLREYLAQERAERRQTRFYD